MAEMDIVKKLSGPFCQYSDILVMKIDSQAEYLDRFCGGA